jgi:hypothetical protein
VTGDNGELQTFHQSIRAYKTKPQRIYAARPAVGKTSWTGIELSGHCSAQAGELRQRLHHATPASLELTQSWQDFARVLSRVMLRDQNEKLARLLARKLADAGSLRQRQ